MWGTDLNRRWSLESTFRVDYVLPICLPEKALSSPRSLDFYCKGFKTIPDCIRSFSGLSTLGFARCKELVALPQLPASLQFIDAQDCRSLKRIDSSSFQNPNICLNFSHCTNLNQKAKKLIQTSACKYAVLPGEEVPAYFPHRDGSGSLKINLTPRPLPSPVRFKACILLSYKYVRDFESTDVSCCVRGKQSDGRPIEYISIKHHMPWEYGYDDSPDHLYIFEDSFCLNKDFPEAEEATFSELSFEFIVHGALWNGKGCGVRLLGMPHDGNEDDDGESIDGDDDENADDGDKDETADDGEGC